MLNQTFIFSNFMANFYLLKLKVCHEIKKVEKYRESVNMESNSLDVFSKEFLIKETAGEYPFFY